MVGITLSSVPLNMPLWGRGAASSYICAVLGFFAVFTASISLPGNSVTNRTSTSRFALERFTGGVMKQIFVQL